MSSSFNEVIARAISLGKHGSICNAEMWNVIVGQLDGPDMEAKLAQLDSATQQSLASEPRYSLLTGMEPIESREFLHAWCERRQGLPRD